MCSTKNNLKILLKKTQFEKAQLTLLLHYVIALTL